MAPVAVLRVSPVGSVGDTDQEVTVPVTVGVSVVIAVPEVSESELDAYDNDDGGLTTEIVMSKVSLPAALVAVTV